MDIGKSFTFVFEDEAWVTKILIMAAILFLGVFFSWLLLIPAIVAAALINGYMVEIIRRVIRGQVDGLPEWDNWGDLIAEGLKVLVIQIVYMLPIIIASFCMIVPAAAAERGEAHWPRASGFARPAASGPAGTQRPGPAPPVFAIHTEGCWPVSGGCSQSEGSR